jgi:pilus assembly protein FimV
VRKISKTVSIISLLAPVGASALGIGDIQLYSALNQGLEAEIPLLTSGTDVSEIKAGLASPGAFARAGIDRHYFLSNLHFKPVVRPNGRMVIKVTSAHAVQEPYLNFLVEVRSPSGRALKEFTVLLDPPSSFEQPTASVLPSHQIDYRHQVAASDEVSRSVNRSRPKKARANRSTSGRSKPKAGIQSGTYGPTVRNDTLSRIAKRINHDPVISMDQMIVALYEANPGAFYKDNVNALKAGVKLKIPPRDAIVRTSQLEAREEVKRQHARWLGRYDVKTQVASVEKTAEKKIAKVATTPEKSAQKPAVKTPKSESTSQLKLAVPSKSDVGSAVSGATPGTAAATKAERAFEMAETLGQENDDLRSRLGELEKQIASMQSLLTLKDEQLAALQATQQQQKLAQSAEPASVPDGSPIAATTAQEDNAITSPQAAAKVEQPAQQPAVKLIAVKKKQLRSPVEEDDWFSEILSDPLYLAAGGGIVLLAVLGWVISRRKREAADKAESILAVPTNAERSSQSEEWVLPVLSDNTSTKSTVPVDGSFLSEFALSDFDTLESEHQEVDAIAEADVYLAYGRYEQAETLIRQAIDEDPSSSEYKLKLFEIFYADENKESFEGYASELRAENSVTTAEFWEKVSEMGRELCSGSLLFRPEESSTVQLSNDEAAGDHGVGDFIDDDSTVYELNGIDLEEQLSGGEAGLESIAAEQEAVDLDGSGTEATFSTVADEDGLNLDKPLEFEASPHHSQQNEADLEEGLLDIEWSDQDVELEIAESGEIEIDEAFNALPVETADQDKTGDDDRIDVASDSLSFELADISPRQTKSDSDDDPSEEIYASLIDMDEIETKLDLAKAYVEMEDVESAHDILKEVLVEGNDEQKDEAQVISAALNVK